MNEQNRINFAREVKRVEDDRNIAEDIWGGIVGHDDLPPEPPTIDVPTVPRLLRHRLAHEVLITMSTSSADPAKLQRLRQRREGRPDERRDRRSPPSPSLSANTIAACDGLRDRPRPRRARHAARQRWARTRLFVETVRDELLAADNHDGGPITISDAALAAALAAKGVGTPPPVVPFDPISIVGIPQTSGLRRRPDLRGERQHDPPGHRPRRSRRSPVR